jgi:flagellar operon protein (TIGR03826 family)
VNIDYCPKCKKVYVKNMYGMCGACIREIENEYERCLKYLREYRKCNINELSEATDVSVRQITKFIREGRISIANAPNMEYPCEVCGTLIREGAMCDGCRARLVKDVKHMSEDEKRRIATEHHRHTGSTYQIKKE